MKNAGYGAVVVFTTCTCAVVVRVYDLQLLASVAGAASVIEDLIRA